MARRPFPQALLASALALPLLSAPATTGRPGRDVGRGERLYDARLEFNHSFRAAPGQEETQALRRLAQTVSELAFEPDPTTGVVRSLSSHTGYLTGPDTGEPSAVGLAFVTENLASLGLDAEDLEYGPAESVVSPLTGATRVYLQQHHAGLPVYDARLQINMNREGRILSVNNSFLPGLRRAANTLSPRLGLAAAVRAARAFDAPPAPRASEATPDPEGVERAPLSREPIEARLALLPVRQGMARLVWNFQLPTADARPEHDVTVDAVTGKVWTRFERSSRAGRQVGGPAGASCFTNRQHPGEGLSEWWARASSGGDVPGASAEPDGTTWTYESIRGMSVPRGVGAVWAQVLSNAAARLAEDWGIAPDPTDRSGNAGNQRMLLYVAEGVQNAGCTPTFTQMRDGILQAAVDNHGGEDVCRLWQAFAAFGLGTNAVSGGPESTSPTNGFDLPASCGGTAGTLAFDARLTDEEAAPADPGPDRATTLALTRRNVAPTVVLAAAQGGTGASLPYVEVQAENAATNGTVIGPSFIYNQLACEASGRKAVTLAGQGRFVEFTLPSSANSIVVRYSIPDTANGSVYSASLSLYIDGVKQPSLTLTNAYSWYYGGYPFTNAPGSNPHHFYDEVHRLLPSMAAGAKVRLQVDAENTAASYTIDLADFEHVGPPRAQPANSVSVTSFGADPTGSADSTAAFNSAVAQAAGRIVWIPSGTFRVNGHVIVNNVTVEGAGMWYSIVTGQDIGFYGNYPPTPSTNVHLSHFEIRGNVQERNDGAQVNGIGGALQNSTVSDIWIEHTKVGAWMDGPFSNLAFTRMRIRNQTADAINFHNGITGSSVTQSHFRNLGDDGLAMWSEINPDANNSFTFNTVELPILANGIAIYGGRDNTVNDNRVVDAGLSQGGGIHLGNRFAATPLAGVTNVRRNTIVRSGDLDPNWQFGVGALWFDARDQAMTGEIVVDDILIQQSPYEAIQFVSGSSITNVSISNATITGTGTFVLQLQVGGSATFTNAVATGVGGPAGIYNCGVPFTVIDGGGNSGWQTTFCGPWPNPIFPPAVGVSTSPTALTFGAQTTGTTSAPQSVLVSNSASGAAAITSIGITGDFAQTNGCGTSLAAGASCTVSVTFRPTAAGTRTGALTIATSEGTSSVSLAGTGTAPGPALSATPSSLSFASAVVGTTSAAQSVSLQNTGTATASISSVATSGDFAQTSTCGPSLAVGASCSVSVTFRPTASGARTGTLTITSNAVNSPTTVSLAGNGIGITTNVALNQPTTASSSVNGAQTPSLAVDGNADTYWESANNAFPQWLQVDLGSVLGIGRVVIKLPPAAAWATRTQTLSIAGSTDGAAFTTLVPAAGYTFNPATGNAVTITFPASSRRYVRVNFTANTGWPAAQVSELEVYPAGPATPSALTVTPSSLTFASQTVGTTSPVQAVTLQNPGASAASISSIGASGDFAQTNGCGASLAAGASCTINVTFQPTAAGARAGTLTITSSAPGSPTTASLSGSGVASGANLALGKTTSASTSVNGAQTPNLAVDGNAATYWESANNAFPQWLQVDLGAPTDVGRIVLKLPTGWGARTQTLLVAGSTDGSTFTTIVAFAGYTFDPATGNTVTITFPATSRRYVRLTFTANTGWPAGQVSELEVYAAGPATPSALTVTPSSLTFASRTVGSTSPAQSVTLQNPGTGAASIGSIGTSGDFAQTNGCGTSLAAGASCAINVTFRPTAAGARTGTLTIASSAPGSPTTVSLSGTGVASGTNLALGKTMSASSSVNGAQTPNFANDDNPGSYWEGANNAFPQWLQVDLAAPTDVGRIVLRLPPSTAWGTRTQTLSVAGSTDGSTSTTIVASAGYTFDPATGNTVTITFASTSRRFIRLNFTANTGWPAGQVSELQVFAP